MMDKPSVEEVDRALNIIADASRVLRMALDHPESTQGHAAISLVANALEEAGATLETFRS